MDKQYDIVAMGEAMVEFNQTMPGQSHYLQGFGGDTSNAIIAAARAGARCSYVTAVGNDSFGHDLLRLWRESNINIAQAAIDTVAPTGIYFVTHGATGHEFSYRRTGSAAALMTLNAVQRQAITSTKILHLSGISLAISPHAQAQCMEAIDLAKAAGAQISFDSNLRLKLWSLEDARAAMLPVIARADIFLPSLDDVVALSDLSEPQAIVDWCHQLGAKAVFLKLGAGGVLVSHHGQRTHLPAHAVQAVDATGAGDCFAGNLLARLCAGDSMLQAARYANAAAALAVQGFGAVAPLPKLTEVQALMTSAP
ncbi:MAG: sugar kinase [Burkholderiaceae bacterium]